MTDAEIALKRELVAALLVVRESVPLALARLKQGGVDLLAQSCFWSTIEDFANFIDLIDYSADDIDRDSPNGLINRIETLEEELKETT